MFKGSGKLIGCQQEGHYLYMKVAMGKNKLACLILLKSQRSESIDWWIWSAQVYSQSHPEMDMDVGNSPCEVEPRLHDHSFVMS